jgi:FKBP-type peptidyl-prolyl cis-trans isomerase FklB
MKKIVLTIAAAMMLAVNVFSQDSNQKMDSISYSLGVLFAQNLKNTAAVDVDAASMAKGFAEAMKGTEVISAQNANQIFSKFMEEAGKKKYVPTIEAGKKFLDENGKRAGVKTTASGLQYEVIKAGTGDLAKATDKVTVHYHGTLINGKVFDSSVQRGQTIDFPVNGVIQGWQEALQLMNVGAKYKLFIPYNLAYGERGAGADIGPYETLVFEVELFKIN